MNSAAASFRRTIDPKGNHYLATLPDCARDKIRPYKYIDSKDYGANM